MNETTTARLIDDCEARHARPLPALRSFMADALEDVNAARVASLRAEATTHTTTED